MHRQRVGEADGKTVFREQIGDAAYEVAFDMSPRFRPPDSSVTVTEHFTKDSGDVGQFILQQAIRYGGSPTSTNGLPVVTSHWRYLEDAHGMQIHLPADTYSDVELFLEKAFAGTRQFGPAGSADTRTRIHEYRMTAKGGGIQLSEQDSDTLVVVLRPFGVSK